MIQPLRILFTPSLREGYWLHVIHAEAAARGLSVANFGEGEADILLAHAIGHDEALAQTAGDWIILADSPEAALSICAAALEEAPAGRQSWLAANHRLAPAALLAGRGSRVFDMGAARLDLPRLGPIEMPFEIPVQTPPAAPQLGLYARLPIPVGAASVWPADLFNYPLGDDPTGGEPQIDLTGRARTLMFGPYATLPPGRWRATVKVMVDPEGGWTPLWFDWGAQDNMTVHEETIHEAGVYSLSLDGGWDRPTEVQMRAVLTQPVFQGRFEMLECRVERLDDAEPAVDQSAETASSV